MSAAAQVAITAPARERFRFIRVEAVETLDHKGKNGTAEIRFGRVNGEWIFATGYAQRGGDCLGSGGPLGFTHGRTPESYATRDAALLAAMAQLRKTFDKRPVEMASQCQWLASLRPAQLDLFG